MINSKALRACRAAVESCTDVRKSRSTGDRALAKHVQTAWGLCGQLQKALLSRSTRFPMGRTLFIEAVPFKQVLMKIVLGHFSVPGGKLGTRAPHPISSPQE